MKTKNGVKRLLVSARARELNVDLTRSYAHQSMKIHRLATVTTLQCTSDEPLEIGEITLYRKTT